MPSFTTPIHEFNACHGPEDGKFCSDPAAVGGAKDIPAGERGECFRNASQFVRAHEDFALVHGKVTNGDGQTFDHAWAESKTEVADPTTGVQMAKDRWYALVKAQPEAKYSAEHAALNMVRTRNHGPWTAEEVGPRKLPLSPSNVSLTSANVDEVLQRLQKSVSAGVTLMGNLAKYPGHPRSLHVQFVGVDKALRKQRLGAQTMDKVERLAADNDLIVTMSSANPASKAFFVKRGYVSAPRERDPGFMYKDPRRRVREQAVLTEEGQL